MFCRIVFCDKSKGLKKKRQKKTKNNYYFHLSVQHPIVSTVEVFHTNIFFTQWLILFTISSERQKLRDIWGRGGIRKSRVCEIFFGLHSSINCHLKVGLPNPTEKRQWTILSRRWQFIQENSNGNLSSFAQVKDFL